ncbi:MAG TPA: hypothetical protein VK588_15875 [Chitinophagaceae bacterium]|nr:hypothetical protein [Chitinophagaceae bacterium]
MQVAPNGGICKKLVPLCRHKLAHSQGYALNSRQVVWNGDVILAVVVLKAIADGFLFAVPDALR